MRKIDYSDLRWNSNEYEIYAGYPLGHVSLNAEIDNLEQFREITSGISLDRLREICDAEREGRLVVLPCKVWDTIYKIVYDCIKGVRYNPFNEYGVSTAVICCKCDTYPCNLHKTVISVIAEKEDWIWENKAAFGKTVFLTREEAEAALRKEQSDER